MELEELLEAWRAHRAPEIADAIDAVSVEITKKEEPIRTKAGWYAAVAKPRAAQLGRLLELVVAGLDRVKRLEALRKLPPDPRVGTLIRTWLEKPPVTGKQRAPFFGAVIDLIEYLKDVRLTPVLAAVVENRNRAIARFGLPNYKPLVALAEAMAKQKPKPIDKALAKRLSSVAVKPVARGDADELFARVYADPSDNDVRAVLSDVLSERGDPRGEFIALQLARHGTDKPATKQERKLEQTWGRTWLGPLEPLALKGDVQFERGFVASLRYTGEPALMPDDMPASMNAPEWSTVTRIDIGPARSHHYAAEKLLRSPRLRNLTEVRGMTESDFGGVIRNQGKFRWPTIGLQTFYWRAIEAAVEEQVKSNSKVFGNVKRLILANADSGEWHVDTLAVANVLAPWHALEEFEIEADTAVSALFAHAKRLRRITVSTKPLQTTLDRASNTLSFEIRWGVDDTVRDIAKIIAAVTPAHVTFTAGRNAKLEGDTLTQKYLGISIVPIRKAVAKAKTTLSFNGLAV